jgi:hypothetical protein
LHFCVGEGGGDEATQYGPIALEVAVTILETAHHHLRDVGQPGIAAAKLGKTVAVIERDRMLGGVCTNTGTIPSKTLREAVVYLTGITQRELYGASYQPLPRVMPMLASVAEPNRWHTRSPRREIGGAATK